jgi:hypothetical protein
LSFCGELIQQNKGNNMPESKIISSIRRLQEIIINRGTGKIGYQDEDYNNEFVSLRKELGSVDISV